MLHLAPLSGWTAVVDGVPVPLFPPTHALAGMAVRAAAAHGEVAVARAGLSGPLEVLVAAAASRTDEGAYVLPL